MVLVQVCGRESEPDAGAGTLPPAIQPKAMKKISPEEIAEERYPVNPDTMTTLRRIAVESYAAYANPQPDQR